MGSISKKYYKLIVKGSSINNTFTYELRSGSKAQKVFLNMNRKNSLMIEQINERIALKELLIYLRCSNDKCAFLDFIDNIEPLDFDSAMVTEYLSELVYGNVSQDLIDEVEYLYSENKYSAQRIQTVDLFANNKIYFD